VSVVFATSPPILTESAKVPVNRFHVFGVSVAVLDRWMARDVAIPRPRVNLVSVDELRVAVVQEDRVVPVAG